MFNREQQIDEDLKWKAMEGAMIKKKDCPLNIDGTCDGNCHDCEEVKSAQGEELEMRRYEAMEALEEKETDDPKETACLKYEDKICKGGEECDNCPCYEGE